MIRNEARLRSNAIAAAIFLAVAGAHSLPGATITDTYIGPDQGLWSNPAYWSAGAVPSSSSYDVVLNDPAGLTTLLDVSNTINNFSVSGLNTLSILTSTLNIAGNSLTNAGAMVFNGSSSNPTVALTANTTLSGAGTILLNSSSSKITGTSGMRLTTDNLIAGQGSLGLGLLKFTNSGTIIASTGVLTIYPLGPYFSITDGFLNTGALRADGGTLVLTAAVYNNTGGIIEAINGSIAQILMAPPNTSNASSLTGGIVRGIGGTVTLGGGSVFLTNVSLEGNIANGNDILYIQPGTMSNAGILTLASPGIMDVNGATVKNSGTVTLGTGSINFAFNSVLTGGGTILMNSPSSKFFGNSGDTIVTDNVIMGQGKFSGDSYFNSGTIVATTGTLNLAPNGITNTGTLRADGGTLIYTNPGIGAVLINTGGTIDARNGSTINFILGGNVSGGTVRGDGGTLSGNAVTMQNVTFAGNLNCNVAALTLNGTTANTGTITMVNSNTTSSSSPVITNSGILVLPSATLTLNSDTTLTGGGAILMNNTGSSLTGVAGVRLTTDNTISGQGQIGSGILKISNSGSIIASGGALIIAVQNAADSFLSTGTLRADGAVLSVGNRFGIYTTFVISGTLESIHGGTLNLGLGNFSISCPITLADNSTVNLDGGLINVAAITGNGTVNIIRSMTSDGVTRYMTSDGVTVTALSLTGALTVRKNGFDTGTSRLNSLTIYGSTGHWGSRLDLNDNKFILETSGGANKAAKLSVLANQILSGYDNGDWLGWGVTSSTVAADASVTGSHLTTLALFDNAHLNLGTFGGQTVDANSLLITTALIGDANDDGFVTTADFDAWYAHAGTFSYLTEFGDFNHDGRVDGQDFSLWYTHADQGLANAYIAGLNLDPAALSAVTVPEPASIILLASGWFLIIRRRVSARRGLEGFRGVALLWGGLDTECGERSKL